MEPKEALKEASLTVDKGAEDRFPVAEDRQEECAQRLSIPSEVQHGLTMHTESRRLAVSMLPCQSLPHLLSVVA